MREFLITVITLFSSFGFAQQIQPQITQQDSISKTPIQINGYQRIMSNLDAIPQGVTLGGYGEILYNQPDNANGELDVQRLVLLFGYKFDERVQFITEIEFEHVKEVYVEQAFINYNLTSSRDLYF